MFKEADEKESVENIRAWLYEYISPFALSDPRSQTDLREKTLAIAVYIYLADYGKNENLLPEEYIIKFIDYASKQDWYDDTLLAFISSLSRNTFSVCESAIHFLKEKLHFFISQHNIEAIGQSLLALTNIEESEKMEGKNVLNNSLSSSSVQTDDYAWSLLGFSKYETDEDYRNLVHIKEYLCKIISNISGTYIARALSSNSDSHNPIHSSQKNKTGLQSEQSSNNLSVKSQENLEEDDKSIPIAPTVDWGELGLITACLCLSGLHYATCIVGYSKERIIGMLEESKKMDKGIISISKQANFIGNLMAILTTLLIGIVGFVYIFGIQIENAQIKITYNPNLGDFLLMFVWGDYLLSEVRSLIRGESALEELTKIPFIRNIDLFQRRKDV